jgi:hypothetical protein
MIKRSGCAESVRGDTLGRSLSYVCLPASVRCLRHIFTSGMSWWPLRCQDEPVLLWAARLLTADIVLLNLRFSIHPLYIDWG